MARRWGRDAQRTNSVGLKGSTETSIGRCGATGTNILLSGIGKKYQWLALYELVARISDNLARIPSENDDRLRLRTSSPSLLLNVPSKVTGRRLSGPERRPSFPLGRPGPMR